MHSSLMSHFLAEARRVSIAARRYPVQTFSGMLTILVLFIALLAGARFMAGPLTGGEERQGALLVGLVLWNMLMLSIGDVSSGLQGEAQIGTLEHLFLCSRSLLRVVLVRAFTTQVLFVGVNAIILTILALISGVEISLSPAILPPLAAALLAASGIGLVLGSLALLWKKVGASLQLVQFLVVSLVVPPFEQLLPERLLPVLAVLPLTPAAEAIRNVMARGAAPGATEMAVVMANGVAYFLIGALVFRSCERLARRTGALAGY